MTLSFFDFLILDSIVNRRSANAAPVITVAYTKRGKAKEYERWLNTSPVFDAAAVRRQNLTEAAARLIYGNPAVDHYLAHMGRFSPWQEPFVGYFDDLDWNDLDYYDDAPNLRCHQPTYLAHHPS